MFQPAREQLFKIPIGGHSKTGFKGQFMEGRRIQAAHWRRPPTLCTKCLSARNIAHVNRWKAAHPERVRAYWIKANMSPRRKIARAKWADAHMEEQRLYSRRYKARHIDRSDRWTRCHVLLCPNVFLSTVRNRNRRLCDECRVLSGNYYSTKGYATRAS